MDRAGKISAGRAERRRQPEQYAGHKRDRQREAEHAQVECNLVQPRYPQRAKCLYDADSRFTQQKPGAAAEEREKDAFGEELSREPPLPCAQRRAQREFPAPRERARQQQIGHVGARDQQHHSDSAEQQEQGSARVTRYLQGERLDTRIEPPFALRKLLFFPAGKRVQLRLGLARRNARSQPRHHRKVRRAARLVGQIQRDPELRLSRKIHEGRHFFRARKGESRGHYADHRIGLAVQFDGATKNRAVPTEPLLP